jgi:hypothetical protein
LLARRGLLLLHGLLRWLLLLLLDILWQLFLLWALSLLVLRLGITRLNLRRLLSKCRLPPLLPWLGLLQLLRRDPPYLRWLAWLRLAWLRLNALRRWLGVLLRLRRHPLRRRRLDVPSRLRRLALLRWRRYGLFGLRRNALRLRRRRLDTLLRRWWYRLLWHRLLQWWHGLFGLRWWAFFLRLLLSLLARVGVLAGRGVLRENDRALAGAGGGGVGRSAPLRDGECRQHRAGEQEVARFSREVLDL